MRSLREKTPTFTTEIVVARESFAGDLHSGLPFIVRFGDRRQATDEVVTRYPQFFQDDGTMLVPFERPEVEPEPEPKRKAVKRYRVTKARIVQVGVPGSKEAMVLREGDVFPEKSEPWMLLTAAQRKEILEEVK